jgi:hypothetical protein
MLYFEGSNPSFALAIICFTSAFALMDSSATLGCCVAKTLNISFANACPMEADAYCQPLVFVLSIYLILLSTLWSDF